VVVNWVRVEIGSLWPCGTFYVGLLIRSPVDLDLPTGETAGSFEKFVFLFLQTDLLQSFLILNISELIHSIIHPKFSNKIRKENFGAGKENPQNSHKQPEEMDTKREKIYEQHKPMHTKHGELFEINKKASCKKHKHEEMLKLPRVMLKKQAEEIGTWRKLQEKMRKPNLT